MCVCVYRRTSKGLRRGLLLQHLLPKGPPLDRQGPREPGPSDPSEKTVEAEHTMIEISAQRYILLSKAITSATVNINLVADLNINTHIMSKQVRKERKGGKNG